MGEVFRLMLEGLPTAGYVWHVQAESKGVAIAEIPLKLGSGRIGGSTGQCFTIEAAKPGRYRLMLEYGRPWEKDPVERATITVTVTK